MNDRSLWELRFGVEVSARYHDWRRGTMESCVRLVRGVTFSAAILTLLTALDPLDFGVGIVAGVVSALAVTVALVNLIELLANFDGRARRHTDLFKRFKTLQARIARSGATWQDHIAEWEAEAQDIRADEPPTFWALYASCWNQTIEHHEAERAGYYRRIGDWQYRLRNVVHFRPQDFPMKEAHAA